MDNKIKYRERGTRGGLLSSVHVPPGTQVPPVRPALRPATQDKQKPPAQIDGRVKQTPFVEQNWISVPQFGGAMLSALKQNVAAVQPTGAVTLSSLPQNKTPAQVQRPESKENIATTTTSRPASKKSGLLKKKAIKIRTAVAESAPSHVKVADPVGGSIKVTADVSVIAATPGTTKDEGYVNIS